MRQHTQRWLLWVGACCLMAGAHAAPLPPDITVVADDNYPPYVFRDSRGRLTGLTVDLWSLWEAKTGTKVKLVGTNWAAAQQQFREGKGQVIDTMFRTPEREKLYVFSKPYADLPVQIYTHQDIGGLTSVALLSGFEVAIKSGDACGEFLKREQVRINDQFDSYESLVKAAAQGHVRVLCMDEPPGNYLLYKAGIDRQFRKAFPLYTGQFHRAYKSADTELAAQVEQGFDAITEAERQALRDRWLGAQLMQTPWIRYLEYASGLSLILASLFMLWSFTLRRMVRQRTGRLNDERRMLQILINTLPDQVWFKDLQGVYRLINAQGARFFGRPPEQIVGKSDLELTDAAMAEQFRSEDALTLANPDIHTFNRSLTYKDDGHVEQTETLKTQMRDAKGYVIGVLGIARDVTAQRENERRIQRLNRLYQVLTQVNEVTAQKLKLGELYQRVCDIIVQYGGVSMAFIGEPDVHRRVIRPVWSAGQVGQYLDGLEIDVTPVDEGELGPTATAFLHGRPDYCEDITHAPRMAPWKERAEQAGFQSIACLPLKVGGVVRAVFNLYTNHATFFGEQERELVDRLAGTLGMALEAKEAADMQAQAQARLAQSEARFSQMFLTSPIGMMLCRLQDQQVVDVNEAWQRLFGLSRALSVGRGVDDLKIWAIESDRSDALQRLNWGEDIDRQETVFRTQQGDIKDVAWSATRITLGDEVFLLESFIDISMQKQSTKNLEYQNERLETAVSLRTAELNSLFQALPDQYFRLFLDGTIIDHRAGSGGQVTVNRMQKGMKLQQGLPAAAAQRLTDELARLSVTAGAVLEYTLHPLPSAADPHAVHAYEARLLPLGQSEAIAVIRDVTEQKALEREREAARVEAERLATVKSEFLANMSHEIRTPLNGVLGLAQVGFRESQGQPSQKTFETILNSGRLLLGVLNDILDISKIEAGQLNIECEPLSVRTLLGDVEALMGPRARDKGLELLFTHADDLPVMIEGDALRIEQVLLNLLSNAVKFTEQGRVALHTEARGDRLVFRVADTGIGMRADEVEQVFAPFKQADSSTTRRYGGTGLGLSISRRLVELMGGQITVDSAPGRGSRFDVSLPLHGVRATGVQTSEAKPLGPTERPEPPTHSQTSAQLSRPSTLAGVRVLAAEDSEVNQIVLRELLNMEGATYTMVRDGREAVDTVRNQGSAAFDLVLMDVQMPVMDGYEAARQIRQIDASLPIIGLTAHAFGDALKSCEAAGMVAHVSKPYDLRQLVVTMAQHMRRSS